MVDTCRMRKEKKRKSTVTNEMGTGTINSEKSGDETANVIREILVDTLREKNKKIILSYIL